MDRLGRFLLRHWKVWVAGTGLVLAPLWLLNLSVAFFGQSVVFPLSPSFVGNKLRALGHYFQHRPLCLIRADPELEPLVRDAERRHGLPRGLLGAVIEVESGARLHRISPAGAMGPAQLTPDTALLLGVEDPFDPAEAVEGSARYLAQHLRRYRHDVRLAVAAYNAGPGNVRRHVPRNGETEFYVAKVMKAYARLAPPPPRPKALAKQAAKTTPDAATVRPASSRHAAEPERPRGTRRPKAARGGPTPGKATTRTAPVEKPSGAPAAGDHAPPAPARRPR